MEKGWKVIRERRRWKEADAGLQVRGRSESKEDFGLGRGEARGRRKDVRGEKRSASYIFCSVE